MTRKDYIALSEALAKTRPLGSPLAVAQWRADCYAVAYAIRGNNKAFDVERFVKDCDCIPRIPTNVLY